jgi:hypothetical protein
MKRLFLGIIVGLVLGTAATWGYLHRHALAATASAPGGSEAAAKPEEKPKDNPLHLPPAKRTAAGITLAKPTETSLEPVVTTFGRVLDATALVSLAAELETAKAAYAASAKELERVKKLFAANNNASAQSLETAEAAAARDRAAVASARVRLIATWGRKFSDEAPLTQLVEALANGQALIRLDVLPGDVPAAEPKTAQVGFLGSTDQFAAEILGPAPFADPQVQGVSFLALVHDHPLPVGATLRGTLAGKGDAEKALIIPRSAVVYHQGSAWIYVLDEEDTFERKLVTPGRSIGDQVAFTGAVEVSQQVVTTGAQQLLAAELQAGEAPEEP